MEPSRRAIGLGLQSQLAAPPQDSGSQPGYLATLPAHWGPAPMRPSLVPACIPSGSPTGAADYWNPDRAWSQ